MTKQITPITVTSLCDWPLWPVVWPVVWPSVWPKAYHYNLTTNLVQMTTQLTVNDAHLTPLSGCKHICYCLYDTWTDDVWLVFIWLALFYFIYIWLALCDFIYVTWFTQLGLCNRVLYHMTQSVQKASLYYLKNDVYFMRLFCWLTCCLLCIKT